MRGNNVVYIGMTQKHFDIVMMFQNMPFCMIDFLNDIIQYIVLHILCIFINEQYVLYV